MIWITQGRASDAPALGRVMFHTIRSGAHLYTVPERRVWMPKRPQGRRWTKRLAPMSVFVARSPFGIQGFAAVTRSGYVDFAYVLPTAQGRGIFRALLGHILGQHQDLRLTTHASLHAQPAFAALGFEVIHHEVVRRQGQRLRRAFMEKPTVS